MALLIGILDISNMNLKRSLVCNNPFYFKLDLYSWNCYILSIVLIHCTEFRLTHIPNNVGHLISKTTTQNFNFMNKDLKFIYFLLCALFMKNVMHVSYRKGWLNQCYVMKKDWSRIYRGFSLLQSNRLINGVSCKSPQIGNLSCRALQAIKANCDKEPHQNKLVQITKNKTTWEFHLTIMLGICN